MSLPHIDSAKVETLLILENDLVKASVPFGLEMKRTKPIRLGALKKVSLTRYSGIERQLVSFLDVFATCTKEHLNPWDTRVLLGLWMRIMQVSFPPDSLDQFQSDDLIEAYDLDRLQVFRNLRFMELTNYSLLELLTIEWPLLFERAQVITDQMIAYCDEALWSENRTISFNIPIHYVRELQTTERELYEIQFKTLSPLFSGPNRPFGFLGICHCRVLDREQGRKLAFI